MDQITKATQAVKRLSELTLLDRFLFAQVMEDRRCLQTVLSIILGEELALLDLPQTEKEFRTAPWLRSIRLDVYTVTEGKRVINTEVQNKNTGNLKKRSRFYAALVDSSLLAPGEINFNTIPPSYLIFIKPFDLWGCGRYKYTFQMSCLEENGLPLEDGGTRIFLNTHGRNPEGVSEELIELLYYMEHSSEEAAAKIKSQRIKELHNRVSQVKASEEIGVKYMQEWEEKIYWQQEARAEGLKEGLEQGLKEGLEQGEFVKLIGLARKKALKGIPAPECADMLEEEVSTIREIYDAVNSHPDWDDVRICEMLRAGNLEY